MGIRMFAVLGRGKALWSQLLFSLYVSGGFSLVSWLVTHFNLKAFEELSRSSNGNATSLYSAYVGGNIPPFLLGHYIQIFTVAVFLLTLLEPYILRLLNKDNSFARFLYIFSSYMLITIICSYVNFGITSGYLWLALCFAVVFGIIDAIRQLQINYSFLRQDDLSQETKVAMLRAEADKWLSGLSLFTMVALGIGISAALYMVLAIPERLGIRQSTFNPSLYAGAYAAFGMGLGIYWGIIRRVNETLAKMGGVKRSDD